MANLTLVIGSRSYSVTCRDGEQEHILSLAAMIDEQVRKASSGGAMTEVRGLLFAALFLADALKESNAQLQDLQSGMVSLTADDNGEASATAVPQGALRALESLAERVEALTESLEKTPPNA